MKKIFLLASIAMLCCAGVAYADNFVTYSSSAQQNPTDFIDWSQLGLDDTISGLTIPSPSPVLTAAGNPGLVGNTNLGDFLRVDVGLGWINSLFALGQHLVWTGNSNVVGSGGPFEIALAVPVGSVGFGIEPNSFGPYTVRIDLYDVGGSSIGSVSFNENEPFCGANCYQGDEAFVGVGDTTGVNIGFIVINTDIGDPMFDNDFAIGTPGFTYTTATPEPSSFVLICGGLVGMAGVIRRRLIR